MLEYRDSVNPPELVRRPKNQEGFDAIVEKYGWDDLYSDANDHGWLACLDALENRGLRFLKETELHVVGISGGKDSTALGLRLAELHPDRAFLFLITPTGNELPEMVAHWAKIQRLIEGLGHKWQAIYQPAGGLHQVSIKQGMLPHSKMRWCTRIMKISPYRGYLLGLRTKALARGEDLTIYSYVGLRADEETREGMYGEGLEYKYPFKTWGWAEQDVWEYLDHYTYVGETGETVTGVEIPDRTDCGDCPEQRLPEWYLYSKNHPSLYAKAEGLEAKISENAGGVRSIRSPTRDRWPAPLHLLRAEFELMDYLIETWPHYKAKELAHKILSHFDRFPGAEKGLDLVENTKRVRRWFRLKKSVANQTRFERTSGCRVCSL